MGLLEEESDDEDDSQGYWGSQQMMEGVEGSVEGVEFSGLVGLDHLPNDPTGQGSDGPQSEGCRNGPA
jgi:hypothetical protein